MVACDYSSWTTLKFTDELWYSTVGSASQKFTATWVALQKLSAFRWYSPDLFQLILSHRILFNHPKPSKNTVHRTIRTSWSAQDTTTTIYTNGFWGQNRSTSGICLKIYRKLYTSFLPHFNYAQPPSQCPGKVQGRSAPPANQAQRERNLAPRTSGAWTDRQTCAKGDGQSELALWE